MTKTEVPKTIVDFGVLRYNPEVRSRDPFPKVPHGRVFHQVELHRIRKHPPQQGSTVSNVAHYHYSVGDAGGQIHLNAEWVTTFQRGRAAVVDPLLRGRDKAAQPRDLLFVPGTKILNRRQSLLLDSLNAILLRGGN